MWLAGEMCGSSKALTLVVKHKDLHPIQREGLSEAVSYRVLFLLEDLRHLKWTQYNTHDCERSIQTQVQISIGLGPTR